MIRRFASTPSKILIALTIVLLWTTACAQSDTPGPGRGATDVTFNSGDTEVGEPQIEVTHEPGYAFAATGGGMAIRFPASFAGEAFTVVGDGALPITFAPRAMESRDEHGSLLSSERPTAARPETPGDGTIRYPNTWRSVADVFRPEPARLKHDVVLRDAPVQADEAAWIGFAYELTLPAGYRVLGSESSKEHGTCQPGFVSPRLYIADGAGDTWYTFGRVIVEDASGAATTGHYRVRHDAGSGYQLSLEVAATWLRGATYPVTVDPTIDVFIGTINNWIPFGTSYNTPEGAMQTLYTASQVNYSGLIHTIGFQTGTTEVAQTYPRIQVLMGETTHDANSFSSTYANNYDAAGPVVVFDNSKNVPATSPDDWIEFPLTTPFNYSGVNNLVIEWRVYGPPTAGGLGAYRGNNSLNARLYTTNSVIGATGTLAVGIGYTVRLIFSECGDGNIDPNETCDDGDLNLNDSCPDGPNGSCLTAVCGDGYLWSTDGGNETCDDGDGDNNDSCPDGVNGTCATATCGDGHVWSTDGGNETCDDGDGINNDSCPDGANGTCATATCGDGHIWSTDGGNETCDDGAANSDTTPDACRTDCAPARCGDGVQDTGESCDNGTANSDTTPDACRTDCTAARCGDGVQDTGEGCDDGNTTNGDGCDSTCQPEGTGGTGTGGTGTGGTGTGGTGTGGTGTGGTGTGGTGTGNTSDPGADDTSDDGGCGCRVVGDGPTSARNGIWALALLVGAIGFTRRRRQSYR